MNKRTIPVIIIFIASVTIGARFHRNTSPDADEQAIRQVYARFSAAIRTKDLNGVMAAYARDERAVYFDAFAPRQYLGNTSYRKAYAEFFKLFPGPSSSSISDLRITVSGDLAYATSIDKWTVTGTDRKPVTMVFRCTNVFRKTNGKWLIVHEHLSFPVDPVSSSVDFMSKP